ncbi:MAG TPA: class II aldolase/adducin family protein [Chloroflexota bacterium]|jgi:L-fuculose-phosphate aldolase
MAELGDVKRDVAIANRILAHVGLATGVTASLGHASLRVPSDPNLFVVKGRGYEMDVLSYMRPQDMVVCDLEGRKVDGPPQSTQCFEVKMHSCIFKLYPEVQSIVHVHPRYTIVMSTLQAQLRPMCQEGIQIVRHPLPVYPHVKTVQSDEEGMEVAELLGQAPAILLRGHGATTTGRTLQQSVMNMVHLEEQARMNWLAYCAAGPDHPFLPDEYIEEMTNRPGLADLPHFAGLVQSGAERAVGPWKDYVLQVSKDL